VTMFNPQPHIDEQRYEALAAKAASGVITQAELDEAQALVDEAARSSIRIPAPLTDGEKWADKVMAEKIRSGDLPNLGPGFSDSLRAARALIEIADKKLFMRTKYGSSGLHARKYPVPYLPVKIKKFWEDVNKRATDVIVSEDKIFDLDLSPFVADNDGYLIPLSERFKETSPDIRHNPPDDVLPPGFEGFGFDAPTTPPVEDPQARFRRGVFLNALVGDSVKVGSAIFIIERVFSPYEAMAKKLGAKRKMFNLHQESDVVNVREQKGSWEDTTSMPIVLSDDFDSVSQTIQHLESEHNPPDDQDNGWFIRYTRSDGTGLMHRSAFNMDLLDDDEDQELTELLNYGLRQPIEVPKNAIFAFTQEGVARNQRLLELLTKAAEDDVEEQWLDPNDYEVVWESDDGQVALLPLEEE
jgi:hypothetical protein